MKENPMKSMILPLIIGIIAALSIRLFVAETYHVHGISMEPTFYDGDMVIGEKVSYWNGGPGAGDIVIAYFDDIDRNLIKRVVAKEGSTVEIKDSDLLVDGEVIEEEYIADNEYGGEFEKLELLENEYFLLGDNRDYSADSRTYGIVKKEDVNARVFLRFIGGLERF